MYISVPFEYLAGHTTHAALKGNVDLSKEEFLDFLDLLEKENITLKELERLDNYKKVIRETASSFVWEDFIVDEWGPEQWDQMEYDL